MDLKMDLYKVLEGKYGINPEDAAKLSKMLKGTGYFR